MKLFRANPLKKLEKQYQALLLQARDLQRNGQINEAASRHAEAELLLVRIRSHQDQ